MLQVSEPMVLMEKVFLFSFLIFFRHTFVLIPMTA